MTEKKYYIPQFHLVPPKGWLNDPNGLCQNKGIHHIFFQYSPDDPNGGLKSWGHYETKDFIHYDFTGEFLKPDCEADKDGAYSGCAYVEDGIMYLYYTGNVKKEGNHDYINSGREGNTILITSKDGRTASLKECLLQNEDYPKTLSNHVRDPKVFVQNGMYYMVLGARTKESQGCVLLYTSTDKKNWEFSHFIQKDDFGYMWECPDVFELEGQQYLSVSPQGLQAEKYRYQNRYQSGYFRATKNLMECGDGLNTFVEWDYGFDFYAPQTYLDESGRRILIGWVGVPDAEYEQEPSVAEGWQHMLTVPRELHVDKKTNKILQMPVQEMEQLRKAVLVEGKCKGNSTYQELENTYELLLSEFAEESFKLVFDEEFCLSYDKTEHVCKFYFKGHELGYGRTERNIKLLPEETISNMRILVDTSCMEIYINDGAYAFTTKLFKKQGEKRMISIQGEMNQMKIYALDCFKIHF